MSQSEIKFVLTGGAQGQTRSVNGHQFVDGELTVVGDLKELGGLVTFFGRSVCAFPVGSDALKEAIENGLYIVAKEDSEPKQNGKDVSSEKDNEDGPETPETENGTPDDEADPGTEKLPAKVDADGNIDVTVQERIVDAVLSLDKDNDEHWTEDGLPSVDAVAKLSGVNDVTRANIEFVSPDFKR